jgi:glycyl-tRNA synthetase beta chain
MADLLLELLSEEIPARMQKAASQQLAEGIKRLLQEAELPYGAVHSYVTPRRLTVLVEGVPLMQSDRIVEKKGPKLTAPEAAITGFCNASGVSKDALQIKGEGKDAHYVLLTEMQGQRSSVVLAESISTFLQQFHWPKSMRWGAGAAAWVRPLRSIVCMLDEEIIPVEYAGLRAANITRGHRFMSSGDIVLTHPQEYKETLRAAYVLVDVLERKNVIEAQIDAVMAEKNLHLKRDEGLLEEVVGLVEYPVVLCGAFDEAYLRLPPEVLVLEMRHHQKYFACTNVDGTLSNHFIVVSNMVAQDGGQAILHGNGRVLKARLEDGAFYYEQDSKQSLHEWAKGLEQVIFHQKLGNVAQKVTRIVSLVEYLVVFVPHASVEKTRLAAQLCKADLTTGMVGEFPELQGIMGQYYALHEGIDAEVAEAIKQHYQPQGAGDDVPNNPLAIAVSLADKLDSLAGLFAVGEVPTGSKDPFALRRAALGVIRIIRTHELRVPLLHMLEKAAYGIKHDHKIAAEVAATLMQFMLERLKVALREEGLRYDVIEAVFADVKEVELLRLVHRAHALHAFLSSDAGVNVLAAYKRASNILKKEEQKDGVRYSAMFVYDTLVLPPEKLLVEAIAAAEPQVKTLLANEDYSGAMQIVGEMRPALDAFFAEVTVNSEDKELRVNRLNILAAIRAMLHHVADFSLLEG